MRISLPQMPPLAPLSTRAHVRWERASDTTYVQCVLMDLYVLPLIVMSDDESVLDIAVLPQLGVVSDGILFPITRCK